MEANTLIQSEKMFQKVSKQVNKGQTCIKVYQTWDSCMLQKRPMLYPTDSVKSAHRLIQNAEEILSLGVLCGKYWIISGYCDNYDLDRMNLITKRYKRRLN